MTDVTQNLIEVRRRIGRACIDHGRDPELVRLLAVSKRHPADAVRQLATAGQHAFGESLVQEALAKQAVLGDLDIEWHFVGHIQSNKTRDIANHFDWIHSVDREKTARRLAAQRDADRPPLNVCLQVLLAEEPGKSGISAGALPALADDIASLAGLRLRGLMCIPPPETGVAAQRAWFAKLRALFDDLISRGHDLDTLSMGMSDDLEAAIAEGATVVRIGTALFGPRPANSA